MGYEKFPGILSTFSLDFLVKDSGKFLVIHSEEFLRNWIQEFLRNWIPEFLRNKFGEFLWTWIQEFLWNWTQEILRNGLREIPWNTVDIFNRFSRGIFLGISEDSSERFRGISADFPQNCYLGTYWI